MTARRTTGFEKLRRLSNVVGALLVMASPAAAQTMVVKTDKGEVRGHLVQDGRVRAFKNIPFALPPVGDLRWKPPQPAARWNGVRDATQYGKHCLQVENIFHTYLDTGADEDCLTLNVWAPANPKQRKLPVMVWIYGGGFRAGGAAEPRQIGDVLARNDVVVVSMNYRLGIFGFLAHPELVAESPHRASGNYGLLDQTAALEWVQTNIANFGGDPQNVTIFGQSAGSHSVNLLMASPLSQAKFQKAIGMSGGTFAPYPQTGNEQESRQKVNTAFAQGAFGVSTLADLRTIPGPELLRKTLDYGKQPGVTVAFGPVVDGWFLPEPVPQIFAKGKQAHIPMMAGWTADEQRSQVVNMKVQPTVASFRSKAQAEFGADADEFLKLYPAGSDAEAVRSEGDLANDRSISYSTWRWLDAQVGTGGAPVYRYRFDLGGPGDTIHPVSYGAFHSADIDYAFGQLDTREGATWRPEDRRLSAQIVAYWTNFARTGDPNGSGLPRWPTYKAADGWQVMHLDATSAAKPDAERPRYVFLTKAWNRPGTRPPQPNRPAEGVPRPE